MLQPKKTKYRKMHKGKMKGNAKGIINAIETGANNARAERINGAIQELKTRGRGYRKTENFRIAILFFNGNLKMFPQNSQ